MSEHDDDPDQTTNTESSTSRERPAWLWAVISIIVALVLLQAIIVWYFWVR